MRPGIRFIRPRFRRADQILALCCADPAELRSPVPDAPDEVGVTRAGVSSVQTSRIAKLVWRAYAFLAPGGAEYHPGSSVAAQSGQHFGCRTALQFLSRIATSSRQGIGPI